MWKCVFLAYAVALLYFEIASANGLRQTSERDIFRQKRDLPFRNPLWPSRSSNLRKRDCRWGPWTTDGKCLKYQSTGFHKKRTRKMIKERNGGKKCTGPSLEYQKCSESSFIGTMALGAVTRAIRRKPKAAKPQFNFRRPGGALSQFSFFPGGQFPMFTLRPTTTSTTMSPSLSCPMEYKDSKGNIRLTGLRNCSNTRQKREVDSFFTETLHRMKRQDILSYSNRDLLFIIDESGSVREKGFKSFINFASALTAYFGGDIEVDSEKTRIGVMTFATKPKCRIRFKDHFTKDGVISAMGALKYGWGGSTCTVDALKFAKNVMFTSDKGARVTSTGKSIEGHEKLVILLTDGCANCAKNVATALNEIGEEFDKSLISIIVVMAGINKICVETMKNLDTDSECLDFITAENFDQLDDWADDYREAIPIKNWDFGVPCDVDD